MTYTHFISLIFTCSVIPHFLKVLASQPAFNGVSSLNTSCEFQGFYQIAVTADEVITKATKFSVPFPDGDGAEMVCTDPRFDHVSGKYFEGPLPTGRDGSKASSSRTEALILTAIMPTIHPTPCAQYTSNSTVSWEPGKIAQFVFGTAAPTVYNPNTPAIPSQGLSIIEQVPGVSRLLCGFKLNTCLQRQVAATNIERSVITMTRLVTVESQVSDISLVYKIQAKKKSKCTVAEVPNRSAQGQGTAYIQSAVAALLPGVVSSQEPSNIIEELAKSQQMSQTKDTTPGIPTPGIYLSATLASHTLTSTPDQYHVEAASTRRGMALTTSSPSQHDTGSQQNPNPLTTAKSINTPSQALGSYNAVLSTTSIFKPSSTKTLPLSSTSLVIMDQTYLGSPPRTAVVRASSLKALSDKPKNFTASSTSILPSTTVGSWSEQYEVSAVAPVTRLIGDGVNPLYTMDQTSSIESKPLLSNPKNNTVASASKPPSSSFTISKPTVATVVIVHMNATTTLGGPTRSASGTTLSGSSATPFNPTQAGSTGAQAFFIPSVRRGIGLVIGIWLLQLFVFA